MASKKTRRVSLLMALFLFRIEKLKATGTLTLETADDEWLIEAKGTALGFALSEPGMVITPEIVRDLVGFGRTAFGKGAI